MDILTASPMWSTRFDIFRWTVFYLSDIETIPSNTSFPPFNDMRQSYFQNEISTF